MLQIRSDASGPVRDVAAAEIIGLATLLYRQGGALTAKWVPGHRVITGNEIADCYCRARTPDNERKPLGSARPFWNGKLRNEWKM